MPDMDSREYDRLKARGFRDYSEGHRHMYLSAISRIAMERREVDIFEAGFGIGYGLAQMLGAGIVGRYVGCEPQVDSYNYTVGQNAANAERLTLIHAPFDGAMVALRGAGFDHVFCVEVIEHVPPHLHADFLFHLRTMLKPGNESTLWFSTPCIRKAPKEGVRTTEEWEAMLRNLFGYVEVDRSRWTYLYRCRG